jgi:TPR repeat protein
MSAGDLDAPDSPDPDGVPDGENPHPKRNWDAHLLSMEEYQCDRVLGEARFGKILLCHHLDEPTQPYVCRFLADSGSGPGGASAAREDRRFFRELDIYVRIRPHPAICSFIGCSFSPPAILTEYLPNGSLSDVLRAQSDGRPFPEWTPTRRAKTIFGFAAGMMHLHAHDAVHRFLSPNNILFTANWDAKLVDFGFACGSADIQTVSTITSPSALEYDAPEVIQEQPYGPPVNVYAFGLIAYRIATGESLFPTLASALEMRAAIRDGKTRDFSARLSGFLSELLPPCWNRVAELRPTFYHIVRALLDYDEPLFEGVDMHSYRCYRDHLWSSRYIPPAFSYVFSNDILHEADIAKFRATKERADRGELEAQARLGQMYEKGRGTKQDLVQAGHYYRLAADRGHRVAQYSLGIIYSHGLGVPTDYQEGARWLARASEDRNYIAAHVSLADLFVHGRAIPMELPHLIALLRADADPPVNAGLAQYFLSTLYKSGPAADAGLARHYLELAHRSGIGVATSDLATLMLQGTPTPEQIREAIRIYEQAVDRGCEKALCNLGQVYNGKKQGVPKEFVNPGKAKELFRQGAEQGDATCCLYYGLTLYHDASRYEGDPVLSTRRYQEAAGWFKRGAELGSAVALHNYAKMQALGQGVPVDMNAALDGLIRAAEGGMTAAYRTLADFVRSGHGGLRENPALAARLRERYDLLERRKKEAEAAPA